MKRYAQNFVARYWNARTAVQQIHAGEWSPQFNGMLGRPLTATRNNVELWIGNGPWFCDTDERHFGLLFRHYVWWAGARSLARRPVPLLPT